MQHVLLAYKTDYGTRGFTGTVNAILYCAQKSRNYIASIL